MQHINHLLFFFFSNILYTVSGQFSIYALFSLTSCDYQYECENAKLNQERMQIEHLKYLHRNDVEILCTHDIANDVTVLYNVLFNVTWSIPGSNHVHLSGKCVHPRASTKVVKERLLIFTYLSFHLTQIASSIVLGMVSDIFLVSVTERQMYPAFYLDNPLSFYTYQSSFGQDIHNTVYKNLLTRLNITYIPIFNLQDKNNASTSSNNVDEGRSCSEMKDEMSAFCFYTSVHPNSCFKEKIVDSSNITQVNEAVQLISKNNMSFVLLSGQQYLLGIFAETAGIELYIGSPFYFGYITQTRSFYAPPDGSGYQYADILVNFPGAYSLNKFLYYIYRARFILKNYRSIWESIVHSEIVAEKLRLFGKVFYIFIKRYDKNFKFGSLMTYDTWKNIKEEYQDIALNNILYNKKTLVAILEEGKLRSYSDRINLNFLEQQDYFNPTEALKKKTNCDDTIPVCGKGKELVRTFFRDPPNWKRNYGWNCRTCASKSYKINIGNTPCKSCLHPLRVSSDHASCFDPYFLVFLSHQNTIAIVLIVVNTMHLIFVVGTLSIFIRYKDTPIVVSSNKLMSGIQLLFHGILSICLPVFFIGKPNKSFCTLRPVVIGITLSVIISVNLSKTQKLFMIFKSKVIVSQRERLLTESMQWFLIAIVALIDVVVTVISFNNHSRVNTMLHYDDVTLRKELHCNSNDIVFVQLCFALILVLVNCVQGYRSRRLPSHYKEASHVIYSAFISIVVLIATASIYSLQKSMFTKEITLFFATVVLNITHFSLIYVYKMFIILFRPNLNTKKSFNEKRKRKFDQQFAN